MRERVRDGRERERECRERNEERMRGLRRRIANSK